jgi:hypothetical protein
MADNTKTAKMWQEAAAATKDCLPLEVLERLADNTSRDAKAAAHLAGCAHCQTELAMLKNFEQSTLPPTKALPWHGLPPSWSAGRTLRGAAESCHSSLLAHDVPRALSGRSSALAAVLIVGISLYHGNSDGPGKINPGLGNGQYRSASIHLVSPIADQTSAPAEFHWDAVQGAASYTIELKDVAGITLGSAKSTQNMLPVTPEMKANMIAGKPLKWKVTALDAAGKEIANSSLEQFKVK